MRSAILLGLTVCLVVVFGGLSMSWYMQARASRQAVEAFVAQANAKGQILTYEKIESAGFPREVKINIVRPHFKGRIDELLKPLAEQTKNPAQAAQLAALPAWEEDIALDGSIVLCVNALSDHYTLSSLGNWQSVSKIGDKTFSSTHEQSGAILCSLKLERGSLFSDLWNFYSLARDGKQLAEDFRLFDCAIPATTSLETPSREKIAGSGNMRFYISSQPAGPNQHVRVYLSAPELEVTPRGDEIFSNYAHALNPGQYQMPRKLSAYGKQSVELDFSYNGPTQLAGATNPNIEVNLSKFAITNDAYNTQLHFYLSNNTVGKQRDAKLAMRAESNFSEAYDTLLRELLRTAIEQVYTTPEARLPQMQEYINRYNQDEMYAIVVPAVPNFASMGKAIQSLDMQFTGSPDMKNGEVTLSNLEFSFTPYGIRMVGTGKNTQGQPPSGQLNITCANCNQLIDDLMAYATRLYNVAIYFAPDAAAPYQPDPQLAGTIKYILTDLAGPDKTNLTYDILSGSGGVTINGKPVMQVLSAYSQYLAPYLQQYQPAPSQQFAPAPAGKGPPITENRRRHAQPR